MPSSALPKLQEWFMQNRVTAFVVLMHFFLIVGIQLSPDRPKTGVFIGRYAINPVSKEKLPILASDYVLADYGTGAIMAVPAHDQRDLDFAKAFNLEIRVVVDTNEEDPKSTGVATSGDGKLVNSEFLNGLDKSSAIKKMIEFLEKNNKGKELSKMVITIRKGRTCSSFIL